MVDVGTGVPVGRKIREIGHRLRGDFAVGTSAASFCPFLMISQVSRASSPIVVIRAIRAKRTSDFLLLMKPRELSLVVFSAFVELPIAPGHIDPLHSSTTIAAISRGTIGPFEALIFGPGHSVVAMIILTLALDVNAAALFAFGILFCLVVYAGWLRPLSPATIVINGAVGAFPLLAGWAVATLRLTLELDLMRRPCPSAPFDWLLRSRRSNKIHGKSPRRECDLTKQQLHD